MTCLVKTTQTSEVTYTNNNKRVQTHNLAQEPVTGYPLYPFDTEKKETGSNRKGNTKVVQHQ